MPLYICLRSYLLKNFRFLDKKFIFDVLESAFHTSSWIQNGLHIDRCKSMDHVKQIQSQAIQRGFAENIHVGYKIFVFCCSDESGDMQYARKLFDKMPEPNMFMWNNLIKGYSRISRPLISVSTYMQMLECDFKPDDYTFPFLLKGFKFNFLLVCGKEVHAHICKFGFESNSHVRNALISMYSLCGLIDSAREIFGASLNTDVITWNVMISGYNRINKDSESVNLFYVMEEKGVLPTSVTLVSVLSACAKLKDFDTVKRVNQYVKDLKMEPNIVLENALIDAYSSCGHMNIAFDIFSSMKIRDVISWTSLVSGFLSSGQVDLARTYFDQMPKRDLISWTVMIDGYLKLNRFKDVLTLFRQMQMAKVRPDEFTIVSIITACAHLGALELGEWIEGYVEKNKIKNDVYIGNALIDMYFKCGSVERAMNVFDKMPRKDKFSWTAMIVGFAVNGQGKEALEKLSEMLKASIAPDEITYIGVLSACAHNGMIDEGKKFFTAMKTQHGINPNITHYGCMVDLLGRAGHITEAYEFIKKIPLKPNSAIWGSLLAACRVHRNIETAEIAAQKILEVEADNGAVYNLLCRVYADCNRVDKLAEVRKLMTEAQIKKPPGCSLIEINGGVHEFVAGDKAHPQSNEIYCNLEKLTDDLKFVEYDQDINTLI